MILAIDPGIRGCGVAVFEEGSFELHFARYVKNPVLEGDEPHALIGMAAAVRDALNIRGIPPAKVEHAIVEWPQTYQGSKQKGDPNDLLALAGVDGAICALFAGARFRRFKPREWKGQVDANETADRILKRLTDKETVRIDRITEFLAALERAKRSGKEVGGTDHNTIDAVGVGLKFCGRFEPIRIIHR